MRIPNSYRVIAATIVFGATSTFGQTAFNPEVPAAIPAVKGDVKDAATLRYIDVEAGQGKPAGPGQRYTVHYTGWLRDGTKFDSSRDRNEPFEFVQGKRQVIAGWEAGFGGMKEGGKRRLFIPSALAYGDKGIASIPPKAELIFDVELIRVTDVPEQPAALDVLSNLNAMEKKIVDLAKAIPEDKYGWRPSPDTRSIREVLIHIANANHLLKEVAVQQPSKEVLVKLIADEGKGEKDPLSRDAVVQKITSGFADVRKVLEDSRAGRLASDAQLFGQATTFRGIFVTLIGHASEHLGQLIAYSRMAGVTPPWSVQK